MGNHDLLVFTGESSFQALFGGAGFRPSTVGVWLKTLGKWNQRLKPAVCPSS